VKAVVLAAGLGKRLRPLTNTRPKHLLPVCGKPILDRVLEALLVNNVNNIGIVVSYMSDLIIRHVSSRRLDMEIEWIYQKEPLGTGDALRICEKFLESNDSFIVVYGDITLSSYVLADLINFYYENKCDGVIEGVHVEDTLRFGRIISRDGVLEKIEEKSISGPGIINSGLYILPYEALKVSKEIKLSRRGEYELTDILNILASRDYKVLVHTSQHDWWIDIGSPEDYFNANNKKFIEEFGNRVICNSVIDETIIVKPPSMILENVEISKNAIIGANTFIMKDVRIGSDTIVENSILLEGCSVGRSSILRNVIVGENTRIGEKACIVGAEQVLIIPPNKDIEDNTLIKN